MIRQIHLSLSVMGAFTLSLQERIRVDSSPKERFGDGRERPSGRWSGGRAITVRPADCADPHIVVLRACARSLVFSEQVAAQLMMMMMMSDGRCRPQYCPENHIAHHEISSSSLRGTSLGCSEYIG